MTPAVAYLSWRYYSVFQQFFVKSKGERLIMPFILQSFYLFPISALMYFFITGNINVLKFPKPLDYWFWFGLVFAYALATWVIIADIVKWISIFLSDKKTLINLIHARILLALFIATFCFVGWKTYDNTTRIRVRQIDVPIKGLPDKLDGFKIVHISDIHGDEYTGREKIARYIRKVNQRNPDLIIFTGDLISYGTNFIKMASHEFGKVKSTNGVLAVVGDHDYWAGVENVKRALNRKDISVIQDSNYTVQLDSANKILVTGVTEVYSKKVAPKVVDSLTLHSDDPTLKIFASHQISDHLIEDARQHNYDMMLAGHTHGGQVRVPFMGMTFSASNLETKYISGVYHQGSVLINVNNGLGFTLAPIRYNAPPNISVIRLVSKRNS